MLGLVRGYGVKVDVVFVVMNLELSGGNRYVEVIII